MRMWEPGDPIEGGNDTGIPDIPYFDYLKGKDSNNQHSRDYDGYDGYNDYNYEKKNLSRYELIDKANELFDSGNYADALDYYAKALDLAYSEDAKSGMAECLHKLGRNNEASQLYFELGDRYTWGNSDKDIAVSYYKKAIEFNPYNEDALDNLGYALRELGRYDEALRYYERVKNRDVDWAMAMCYMGLKKYSNAIALLDKVIKENPWRDDHLDQKCECLIGLGRKSEAIGLWKDFIEFIMKNECYEWAIERLDLLSKFIPNDSFIEDNRKTCIENKESLEIRFKSIREVMGHYSMYNPNGLDEDDLKGFMKFVCEQSGESVDDIVRWYTTPMLGSSSFKAICGGVLHYTHWETIVRMYEQGKLKDL